MQKHMEMDPAEGVPVGRDPRTMSADELTELGHPPTPILKAIRQNCISCCMGNVAEVRRCAIAACSLWPYRMGTNPHREPRIMTEEQRSAAAERLRRAKAARVAA